MSSQTPALVTRQGESLPATGESTNSPLQRTDSVAFAPRRSSFIAWTVRAAQLADRIMARAFHATQAGSKPCENLVEITLNGLDRCCRLIPRQQHMVAAERARLQLNKVLDRRETRYRQFLELRQLAPQIEGSPEAASTTALHLNPLCCWMRLDHPRSGAQQPRGSESVLFYLVDGEIRGLRMNLEGQALINELADYQPCTTGQWAQLTALADLQQLWALAQQLADIGLVALSPGTESVGAAA